MKLALSLLKKFVDLPTSDVTELRHILDDLGLEVKDVETKGSETTFNIETLANRGDHVSVIGMAREFAGRFLKPLKAQPSVNQFPNKEISFKIKKLTALCTRYAALEMEVTKPLQVPAEITAYLEEAAGNQPIVDLINYVTLELGQPMHAFDREKIEGEIIIEESSKEEKITGLDNKEYKVPKGSILIKDSAKIIAAAGVIGCANSMVDENTKNIVVESATFDPVTIRKTAKAMGLSTDASYIFERGCDIEANLTAFHRLMHLTAGATPLAYTMLEEKRKPAQAIRVEFEKLKKQLNINSLEPAQVVAHLSALGFKTELEKGNVFNISVPSWRLWDVSNENDIYEEVARIISLNKVILELPPLSYDAAEENIIEKLLSCVEPGLVGNGFIEIISKGFYSNAEAEIVAELDATLAGKHLKLKNAVDSNYSHLKITNILHFAKIAEQNHRKGVLSLKLYEICRLFTNQPCKDSLYEFEKDVLCFAASGRWNDNEWQKQEANEAVLPMFRGVVESLIKSTGNSLQVAVSTNPLLHPGCQAAIKIGAVEVGVFGLAHPLIKERLDLKNDLFYCEIDAEKLAALIKIKQYAEPSEFPAIKRDITLKIPTNEQAVKVIDIILGNNIANLQQAIIHDNFKKAEEEFRRVTYRLTFQDVKRTLESKEIDTVMQNIISELNSKHQLALA